MRIYTQAKLLLTFELRNYFRQVLRNYFQVFSVKNTLVIAIWAGVSLTTPSLLPPAQVITSFRSIILHVIFAEGKK